MKTKYKTRQVLSEKMDKVNFPTREMIMEGGREAADLASDNLPLLYSFIQGIDPMPRTMTLEEVQMLGDVFTQNILLKGTRSLTLEQLIIAIANLTADAALPLRKMFLVAEGGQHHVNHPDFELNARLVFTWQKDNSRPPDMLLSTVSVLNDPESLLQLIAWSQKDMAFNFFERKSGVWAWAGNSFHALDPRSRSKGPFDSHINGGLVMKELKAPWAHWHSQSSTISRLNFKENSEFNSHPLFNNISQAEELEAIVRAGVRRWTKGRIQKDMGSAVIKNLDRYLRQLLTPTSVNLISSDREFHQVEHEKIFLPATFFFDNDGMELAGMELDPLNVLVPAGKLELDGKLYKEKALQLNMNIADENGINLKGDTHFCFLVPERAFEDLEVARQLIEQEIISPKLLLCFLMVDFSNPLDSTRRTALLKYAPDSIEKANRNIDNAWTKKIRDANPSPDSEEQEFLSYLDETQLLDRVAKELSHYFNKIQEQLQSKEYVERLIRLSEYRKQVFKRNKFVKLNEFKSTFSHVEGISLTWGMDKEGNIFTIQN